MASPSFHPLPSIGSAFWFFDHLFWWWGLQACVAWGVLPAEHPADVLSAVTRSRCEQRVVFAVINALRPLPLPPILPILHFSSSGSRELFNVFLFSIYRFVLSYPSSVPLFIFMIWIRYETSFWCLSQKKRKRKVAAPLFLFLRRCSLTTRSSTHKFIFGIL